MGVGNSTTRLASLRVAKGTPGRRLATFRGRLGNLDAPSRGTLRRGTRTFVGDRPSSLMDVCLLRGCFIRGPRPSFSLVGRVARRVAKNLGSHPCISRLLSLVRRRRGMSIKGAVPCIGLPGTGNARVDHADFGSGCLLVRF